MKKSILLIMLLLVCACLVLVACDEDKPSTQPTDTSAESTALPDQTDEVDTTAPETEPQTEAHVHAFGEWTTVKQASCAEQGTQERSCACGEKETQSIDALGHTEVADAAIAPDCTNTGLTEGKHCSVCSEILIVQEEVAALGHIAGEWIVDKAATVKEDGMHHQVCAECGETLKEEVLPATGSQGLAYEVNADGTTCTITGMGICTDTEVYIPATIDGYSVTAIGAKAFAENSHITYLQLPNTIETIGTRAFYKCTGITEFTIPESVTQIDTQIFYGCDQLTTVYYNSNYGDSENAFLNVKNLETVVFGGEYVPSYVAYKASHIKNVVILDSVTSIGYSAFYGSTGLTSVTIGNGVTSIRENAFSGCIGLTSVTIGNGVTSIDDWVFRDCSSLTSVTIPGSVTSIGTFVFYGCTGLTSVTIKNGVTSIVSSAFYGCAGLKSVEIPDSVTSIGDWAFFGCSSLTNISIPDSVTSIGKNAFDGCSGLTNISIPDSVTSIDYYTFRGCTGLTSIVIPDSVTSIDQNAFDGCSSLTSITIPDSVTSIGNFAFSDCRSLTSITIPDSVTSVGYSAFYGCTDLTDVYYTGTEEDWMAITMDSYNTELTNATIHYNWTGEES